jgi:hypothetical protein
MTNTSRRFIAITLTLALPAIAAGQLVPGPEFQVNSHTTRLESSEYGPRVGVAADGSYIVLWQDDEDYSAWVDRFASSGVRIGSDFQVTSTYTYRPTLAVKPDGEFIVAWEGPDGDGYGIIGQRYSSAGSAVGTEIQVNSYVTLDQTDSWAASDGAGNVLIAWDEQLHDGNNRGVFAQRFDSSGAAAGTEFQVNSYTIGAQNAPFVAGDPAGGFVVAFADYRYNGFSETVEARRYDSSGNPRGSEFQVNAYTGCSPNDFSVSIGNGGGFVAAYDCGGRDGDYSGIFARRFASSGAPIGGEFQVNEFTVLRQTNPSVAHDENDGFAVMWMSDHMDSNADFDIRGRRYDSAGNARGVEFQVSTYTFFLQAYPQIASLSGGEFVVVWKSEHEDGYFNGTFGARLGPVGKAIGAKKLIVKNPPSGAAGNQIVLLSKDAGIATPQSAVGDPRCSPVGVGSPSSGARLKVSGPGGELAIDLPCTGWVADAGRTKFTYRDATGATCKRITLKQGRLLKAVCKGPQVAYTLGAAQDEVRVSFTTGNPGSIAEHCMLFSSATNADVASDGSNGRLYKVRGAEAPTFCP